MASRNAGSVVIRLDLRGQEEMKRQLDELGPAGKRLGRDLENAMKPVGTQGKIVKGAMNEAGQAVEGLARQAGPLGSVFLGLNPILTGIGIAVGALALAVREVFVLMDRSRETAEFAAGLETVSREAGIATDEVLGFRTALQLADGDAAAADSSLKKFSERLGEFRNTGQGEGKDAFAVLGLTGPEFDRLPVEDALDRVLEQLARIEDPSRRLSLAEMLGLGDAAPLLQRAGDDIARIRTEADAINAAFTEGTLAEFAAAAETIRLAQARAERARQLQSLATLDAEVARQEAIAGFENRKAALLAERIPVEERSLELLGLQRIELETQLERLERAWEGDRTAAAFLPVVRRELETITGWYQRRAEEAERAAEAEERMAALTARAERDLANSFVAAPAADPATNLTLERRRELEALVEAQLRSLMTPLERVAVLEADLRLARAAGFEITEAQIEQILTEARAREGLVSGLGDELAARQAILDAGAVVPRLRPAKRGSGVLDGLEDPAAAKFKVQQDQAAEAGQVLEAAIERDRAALASGVARFAADGFRAGMTRGLDGALGTMRDRLSDMLMDVFFNSMRNGMMNALNGLSVGSGGLGGLVRGAAGLFGLSIGGGAAGGAAGFVPGPGVKTPGLDGGGDLLIGGRGMDRSLLSIDGSPVARVGAEERVRVVPRGGEGARPAVHQHFHMHAEGAVMTSELMASLQAQANDTAAVAVAESVDIADARAARRAKRSRYALGRG
jgi:hypothetical protein